MKDQVSALNQAGVHAAYLNSSLTPGQYYKALGYAREGRYPIIYVAPERLLTPEFSRFCRPREDRYGGGGRGPLCLPVGAGFQARLPKK